MEHNALKEVLEASQKWIACFNQGNVDYCVSQYTPDATLCAKPIGTVEGTAAIDGFWRPFINSGANSLVYTNVWVKVINATTVHLGANWQMNVGRGMITLEEWSKQDDGRWLLVKDEFEIHEQFESS